MHFALRVIPVALSVLLAGCPSGSSSSTPAESYETSSLTGLFDVERVGSRHTASAFFWNVDERADLDGADLVTVTVGGVETILNLESLSSSHPELGNKYFAELPEGLAGDEVVFAVNRQTHASAPTSSVAFSPAEPTLVTPTQAVTCAWSSCQVDIAWSATGLQEGDQLWGGVELECTNGHFMRSSHSGATSWTFVPATYLVEDFPQGLTGGVTCTGHVFASVERFGSVDPAFQDGSVRSRVTEQVPLTLVP